MNRSLKRRLRVTADLCDFYNIFSMLYLSGGAKRMVVITDVAKVM